MKLVPLSDHVLIERIEPAGKSPGGIVIPDVAKENQRESAVEGRVLAVGPGKVDEHGVRHPIELAVGARVFFARYSGTEVVIDGSTHVVVREGDILLAEGDN